MMRHPHMGFMDFRLDTPRLQEGGGVRVVQMAGPQFPVAAFRSMIEVFPHFVEIQELFAVLPLLDLQKHLRYLAGDTNGGEWTRSITTTFIRR